MDRDPTGFQRALAMERERNSRQISAFRFLALVVVVVLQFVFWAFFNDPIGTPLGPLAGYTVFAGIAWRLRRRFDAWAAWSGYTIAALDMPMVFWLVRSSAEANIEAGTPEAVNAVLMLLPLIYAGFVVMASLALDTRQTLVAAATAIVLQAIALFGTGLTFLSMVTAFTALNAAICVYWREQTVRMVRETSVEQLRRERLGRYFSPQVASLVEAGAIESAADRREVTVLFADLRDFTRLAEGLDSRVVVALLNRFHSAMVDVVFTNGGTLDKYLGDGLMAYFGAPMAQDDQAVRAVRCALGMQRALSGLNSRAGGGSAPLRMGIGVNTGTAVVGDIGAESRREFTVIGDAVNVAARIEQLTKQFELPILVSASTVEAAGAAMPFRLVDRVALRGRNETVEVYAPVDRPADAC